MLKGHLDAIVLAALESGSGARLRHHRDDQEPQRRHLRSARGHGLSGAASAGAGGPAVQRLDHAARRPPPPRLFADQGGTSRARRSAARPGAASRRPSTRRWEEGAHGRRDRSATSRRCGASSTSIRHWRDVLPSEVEDHLRDAAEADPAWPSPTPSVAPSSASVLAREIAAQFADRRRRTARRAVPGSRLLVTVAVTFVAMRLRVMWLDDGAISVLAPLIDRYAFIAAIAVGVDRLVRVPPLARCRSRSASAALSPRSRAGIVRADLFADGAPLPRPAGGGRRDRAGRRCLSFHVVGLGRRLRRTAVLRRTAR